MEDMHDGEEATYGLKNTLESLGSVTLNFQIEEHVKLKQHQPYESSPKNKNQHRGSVHEAEDPPYTDLEATFLEDILQFSEQPLSTSLLKMNASQMDDAVKMFELICTYMGLRQKGLEQPQRIEIALKLINLCAKHTELRNEIYMQLLKQSRNLQDSELECRVWELWLIVASVFDPAKEYVALISEYIHRIMREAKESSALADLIERAWTTIKKTTKFGRRSQMLSSEEIKALLSNKTLTARAKFLDSRETSFSYHTTSTVQEAVEAIAQTINLANYSTFALYEIKQSETVENGEIVDVHKHLEENLYVSDILSRNEAKDETIFLFKKRMFREQDEHITEPIFLALSYIQAQHDFLKGNYPVVRDDAAQMCALQIIVAEGPELHKADTRFINAAEKFTTTQVLMSRRRQDWHQDVYHRYNNLIKLTIEGGKMQFLRIIRTLPYGNSVFFPVKRIADPIGLLPSKVILGINKRGVHFFRPVPKEYLHSAELRDIMQFGSSNNSIFIKMKVAGVLHVFQFETNQGEEICMSLQTHISDIMMKRFARSRKTTESQRRPAGDGLANANFGEKYEHHIKQMHQRLTEHQNHIAKLEQIQHATDAEVNSIRSEFNEARQALRTVESDKNNLQIDLVSIRREITALNRQLSDLRGAMAAAEIAKMTEINQLREEVDSAQAKRLEEELRAKEESISLGKEKLEELERQLAEMSADSERIADRLAELEELRLTEVQDLKQELNDIKKNAHEVEQQQEEKLNDLVEEVANVTAMYNENLAETAQVRVEQAEVQELLELRADIQRRESSHAIVIEGQGKRIEHLDSEYKKEQVMRKRYFNQIEDLKGKIRVYCRVRPMLPFEKSRRQEVSVAVPDDMTITHPWKEEKKDREYVFDSVFTPDVKQEQVFESTKHLVQSAVDGYNVCIFAYGQTGSGKTFTIYGSDTHPGLTPRGITELFDILERDSAKFTSCVKCYMLELYQNTVVDLLQPTKKKTAPVKLDIKTDAGGMVVVNGAVMAEVTSAQQLMDVISAGQRRRHVSATHMNRESSRSHLVMSFIIECTNRQTQAVTKGKLSFVDLAGSERIKKSKAEGEQLKEAQAINKSLSALGNVIVALSQGKGHVPYKDNKLTLLMSDSIGGTAKTLMFVNVSPTDSNLDETQNSLLYATRVKAIKNDPSKILLAKEQAKLKKQLGRWKAGVDVSEVLAEY